MKGKVFLFLAACSVAVSLSGVVIGNGCRQFFVQRQVVAYHQPYYQAPLVLYQAGRDIEAEALAEKVAAKVEERLALRQQQLQQKETRAAVSNSVLSAKCVRCHNPAKANGDLVLDGSEAVPDSAYRRFHKMAGLGEDVPPEMTKVIDGLTVEEKGRLTEELLRLEPKREAREAAPPAEPPPVESNPRPSQNPPPRDSGDLE